MSVGATRGAGADAWRAGAMVALGLLGAAVSAYLTSVHYGGGLALCTGAGGCEQVQASRYAAVAGVPVALLGLGLYLTLLGLAVWRARAASATPEAIVLGLFGLSLAGVLYSAYLTYLELFVIHAICPWCVTSAVLMVALFGLATGDLFAPRRTASRATALEPEGRSS